MTITEFVTKHGITMNAKPAAKNPNIDMKDWGEGSSHWRCTLEREGSALLTFFSMGSAHTEPPTVNGVLDCLASDAAGVENAQSFEDWCNEYGYDTDSRKAERTYNVVVKQAQELKDFLGMDNYNTLLWDTERE